LQNFFSMFDSAASTALPRSDTRSSAITCISLSLLFSQYAAGIALFAAV
jgi:hypothetical protein